MNHQCHFDYFLGCSVDLKVITSEDAVKLLKGNLLVKELDLLSIKTVLALVNLSSHILKIRTDVVNSALKLLYANMPDRKPPINDIKEMEAGISNVNDEV